MFVTRNPVNPSAAHRQAAGHGRSRGIFDMVKIIFAYRSMRLRKAVTFFERSHAVLSMIFGIFGKFGIEIGDPIFLSIFFAEMFFKKNNRKKMD